MNKSQNTELREVTQTAGGSAGRIWPLLTLPAIVLGLVAIVVSSIFAGTAAPSELGDPGAFIRWALPIAKTLHHSAMSITIAALVFAAAILPRSTKPKRPAAGEHDTDGGKPHPAFIRAMNLAAATGMVWTVSAAAVLVFSFWDLVGKPMSFDSTYTAAMLDFVMEISIGRAWAWMIVIAAITSSLAFGVRSPAWVGTAAAFSLVSVLPLSLIGHAAGGDDHWGAVNAMGLHLVGVSFWFGGIGVLAALAPLLQNKAPGRYKKTVPVLAGTVLRRFSAVATISIILVAGSGIVSATIRITSWDQLNSPYGWLVIAKTVLTLGLGALGLAHRNYVIPRLEQGTFSVLRAAWQVVGFEAILMAVVMSLGTVLARTSPPTPDTPPEMPSPARLLSGYDLPPELVGSSWLTVWRLDWLWVAVIFFFAVLYIMATIKVRRRGDKWPIMRMVSWLVGLTALFYITSGAPAVYGKVLFSIHMVDHMALTMVAPLFMVIGSPVTLALKALPSRTDGTRGPREWILALIHSKYSAVITHPLFAAANFAGSIIIFYNTDIFGFALRQHVGHEMMNVHFLITGYLFALSMIGADPVPRRAAYPLRLVILLATMSFHAFYGVSLMGSTSLIQADWFGNLGRPWGDSALEDQRMGAAAMWGIGEVPTLMLALGVMVSWSRDDAKESKRQDRQADRDNDAELAAYNAMFAELKQHDQEIERRGR
ncbi:bifunctional copper resistance protein CopD/cytochrome c oxidase assembly protein [Arthrobacter sp. MYb227]|uniref:bifunctional copper resistance protein CopD/cytochrome c oxidase assembly protein n=1 Tax=Arthrobacter sp. MYb227 TaxID=1848601 RepID=UPI002158493E|nr:bifunctional copper resistance protein CopD/cytochrome c oxidase assembly protein [Arthrobacter sp. MYb227]